MPPAGSDIATRFQRDGIVLPIDVMRREEAATYRRQLEDWEARHADRRCLRRYPNLVLPFIDAITRLPAITNAIAEILGPDLLVLDCPFFIKDAGTGSFVSWHQDLHYWGLAGEEEVTAWVALSPATVESGCMRFIPGSQNQVVDHRDTHHAENLLTRGQEIAVTVDETDAVDAVLQPGQMSLHHGRVFHSSNPNTSGDRRIGLAIRYIPTRMTQIPGANMAAMLVRGEDRYGHFRLCEPPEGRMADENLAYWEEIAGARNAVMMAGAGRNS